MYLSGKQKPATPEQLMRSRYTAYSQANIDYIQKTMCQKAAENYDPIDAKLWASSVEWLGLCVIDSPPAQNNTGTVSFVARFLQNGRVKEITEKSLFEKINNEWFYVGECE